MKAATNSTFSDGSPEPARHAAGEKVVLALSWAAVGLPLLWGVAETLRKALALFQ